MTMTTTESQRNESIQTSIEKQRVPLLAYELILARAALDGYIADQAKFGADKSVALTQTSETWHDNAAADAINDESKLVTDAAEKTMKILKHGEVFPAEALVEDGVTLGSIFEVTYGSSMSTSAYLLTGVSRTVPEELLVPHEIEQDDIDIITLSSPMGKSVIGKSVGDEVSFVAPNGRTITFTICSIDQL
jgi:transcription elongation GreA/GreB family factor